MSDPRYEGWRRWLGGIGAVCLLLIIVVGGPLFVIGLGKRCREVRKIAEQKVEAHYRAEYSAWAKLTGNPNKLTYAEWTWLPRNPWTGAIQR